MLAVSGRANMFKPFSLFMYALIYFIMVVGLFGTQAEAIGCYLFGSCETSEGTQES